MNEYRNIKPELVFGAAAVASMLIGLLFSGYVAEVTQYSLLVFAGIGLVVEAINARGPKRQRTWSLLGVVVSYPFAVGISLFVAIPLIIVAGFLLMRLVSSESEISV